MRHFGSVLEKDGLGFLCDLLFMEIRKKRNFQIEITTEKKTIRKNSSAHVDLRVLQRIWVTEILMETITTDPSKYVNVVRQPQFVYHFYQIAFVVQHQCFDHMAVGYL